jgi:hypothetical protein
MPTPNSPAGTVNRVMSMPAAAAAYPQRDSHLRSESPEAAASMRGESERTESLA